MESKRIIQTPYKICNLHGDVEAIHLRTDRLGKPKVFSWRKPDGTKGLDGRPITDLPLYRTEDIPNFPPRSLVVIAEGEKDTDALVQHGFRAVGHVTGSGLHCDDSLRALHGFEIAFWPDHDRPGVTLALKYLAALSRLFGHEGLFLVDAQALGTTGDGHGAAGLAPDRCAR